MALLEEAEELFNLRQINEALDAMALTISQDYIDKNPLIIGVMNGAVVTMGHLLPKFAFLLEADYCHATRYGEHTAGGEIAWLAHPNKSLMGRHVLLVDDIFDEGVTLKHIARYCKDEGALSVKSAVLLEKHHQRKVDDFTVDYSALSVEDRYVFGFGLDYKGYYRNAPGVYAVPDHLL
ncbi:hypoxanthine-guanine phosphoribosyltransferase [Eionea flava]